MDSIAVIVPCHNEEATIGKVIDEVREKLHNAMVCVIDNACTDQTMEIAAQKADMVIIEPEKGKGNAVRTALAMVESDYVLMLDGDFTYPADYLLRLYKWLDYGFEAAYGWRWHRNDGAMSLGHRIGNSLLTMWANLLYQSDICDLCTGMWGFRGSVAKYLSRALTSTGFTLEADIWGCLLSRRYKVCFEPIHYRKREGSKAKLKILDGFKIAWFLLCKRINTHTRVENNG